MGTSTDKELLDFAEAIGRLVYVSGHLGPEASAVSGRAYRQAIAREAARYPHNQAVQKLAAEAIRKTGEMPGVQ